MICNDVLTCLYNLNWDVLVMWFAHVLMQCEKDLILIIPIKRLELIWTEARQTRRERSGGLKENERNEKRKSQTDKHSGDKIRLVTFYIFLFVNTCHGNTKNSNKYIQINIGSVAKAWYSLLLCGIVVQKLLKSSLSHAVALGDILPHYHEDGD